MSKTIWLGAVAYNPKVVTIWEGMRRYFHDEAHVPVEVVLFQSYEAQVTALLSQPGDAMPRIDIAWNIIRILHTYKRVERARLPRGCYARHRFRVDDEDRGSHRRSQFHSRGFEKSDARPR